MEKDFIDLYNKNSDAVFRYCILRIADREVAVDLVQETFTRYWDEILKNKKIKNSKALLLKIAHNLIIDWYRRKKPLSLETLSETNEENPEEFIPLEDNVRLNIEIEMEGRYLIEKIKNLPKSYQQAIYLKYVEGMNNAEIAKILEINESAAGVRVHRGIEELKKITGYKNE